MDTPLLPYPPTVGVCVAAHREANMPATMHQTFFCLALMPQIIKFKRASLSGFNFQDVWPAL